MSYNIIIDNKAKKEIKKLHPIFAKKVIVKIFELANNPRPQGYIKMSGYESDRVASDEYYRIRVGDNRIIYTIQDNIITVTVVQVKKRGDIY
ncbi:MAG: type II toxin-antitoxin system RelE/ParE family toxin [Emticicia sp.]|nr:type II toxin-antitoxin system RelE/ParE family toxin [Emticicia sp.]